ncbi:MAG TPA: tRNA pseudouridine(13) synthase TruD [Gemmatales bacterium]|nr:tRNA pseudouridine(13) synthase TruD [Gemmatales bacterium]HMP58305.1 tRNA pseudouridine(13) synthase TruD [Gemmatales bacterium]
MKLKQLPQDFQVEEWTEFQTGSGPFAFYRLVKRSLGTPEAVYQLCQALKLAPQRVSYGGLKDRHALTTQHLTIAGGPPRNYQGKLWSLTYLGQAERAFTPADMLGNRFILVLRDLSKPESSRLRSRLAETQRDGVANYFDEQRFRSVSRSGAFVARSLIAGDFDRALHLALAEPYAHDRPAEKELKARLRQHWGDWPLLRASLPPGSARRVASHLADHPTDLAGGFTRLPFELQSLYLSAYQSKLWNELLARWVASRSERGQLLRIRGVGPMLRKLRPDQIEYWRGCRLPLASARLKLPADDPVMPLLTEILQGEGLRLEEMKLPDLRKPFFSKGDRPAWFWPEGLTVQRAADELHPGRKKLALRFTLPRGCYATMLVKRVTAVE